MVWGKIEVKKSLESCYKIQRKFYISEQLNKETEIKKYIWHKKKPLAYTFHYWGAFFRGGLCLGGFCPRPKVPLVIQFLILDIYFKFVAGKCLIPYQTSFVFTGFGEFGLYAHNHFDI